MSEYTVTTLTKADRLNEEPHGHRPCQTRFVVLRPGKKRESRSDVQSGPLDTERLTVPSTPSSQIDIRVDGEYDSWKVAAGELTGALEARQSQLIRPTLQVPNIEKHRPPITSCSVYYAHNRTTARGLPHWSGTALTRMSTRPPHVLVFHS